MNFENIPPEMKKLKNWVCWRLEEKGKVPYHVSRDPASTNDPSTWNTFDNIINNKYFYKYEFDGIGFVFTEKTGLVGVDFDHIRDPVTGIIDPIALEEIRAFNSYTEISQSGTGVHIICRGTLPVDGRKIGNREMYKNKRFFALTGNVLDEYPKLINEAQEAINKYYTKWFPEKEKSTLEACKSPVISDNEVLSLCRSAKNKDKFIKLFDEGNKEDYKNEKGEIDDSTADQALCSLIAFYTQDPGQIDKVFKRSKLYREKWNREDYKDSTINKTLDGLTTVYKGEPVLDEITESQLEEIRKEYSIKIPDLHNILDKNHFINVYCDWLSSLSDTYYEYQVGCAFWLLSALTEKKVELKTKQEAIRPNIWAFILGRSTTSRKSTAIIKTKNIYENATDSVLFNDDYSVEGYLKLLEKQPVNNFVRDEVAGLLAKNYKKYNDGIFDLECTIYDGQDTKKTLSKEEVIVKNPYVTHLYGTTLDSFTENMQLSTILGGYGFRFLYFAPDYIKPRKNIDIETEEDIGKWAEVLTRTRRLKKFFDESDTINFEVDPEAMKIYNHSVDELEVSIDKKKDRMLNSALGRYQIYILKLAMLIEIGKPERSFTIHKNSMDLAIKLITDYFLPSYQDVISRLQEDAKNNQIEKVISVLRRMGNTGPRYLVLKNSKIKVKEFNEVLDTLIASNTVSIKNIINTGGKNREEIILER